MATKKASAKKAKRLYQYRLSVEATVRATDPTGALAQTLAILAETPATPRDAERVELTRKCVALHIGKYRDY